jgi:hypothetical protein
LNLGERFLARVGGSKGDVLGRVPVLGEEDVVEAAGESVDERENFVAAGYGECATGHEVGLEIDQEERVGGVEGHGVSVSTAFWR